MMGEAETRRRLIDRRLRAAGWEIVPFEDAPPLSECDRYAVAEYPTESGPADYALCVDGRILGIVEAKRLNLAPQEVLRQAERYSIGATSNPLRFRQFHVPFLYSTNGEVIWFHDVRHGLNTSRRVADFHTPNALREMLDRDFEGECGWLASNPNVQPRLRPYQIEANNAIEQAIGIRFNELPMSPPKVLAAIDASKGPLADAAE